MKKIYALIFLLLITVHAAHTEQPENFFQILRIDMRAWMKGEASDEQKDWLAQQAGAVILAFSITLFCVVAVRAMLNGEKVPPLPLRSFGGSSGPRKPDNLLRRQDTQKLPTLDPSASMRDLFAEQMPSAHSVLRQRLSKRGRAAQLPTEDPGSPFS